MEATVLNPTKTRLLKLSAIVAATLLVTACGGSGKSQEAEQLIETAYQQKDYQRIQQLADSLEAEGDLQKGKADYWRGYACDRQKDKKQAEQYWRAALTETEGSTAPADLEIYAKSASRLANLLSINGNYEETLQMALPVAERLEKLQCDTTSDYVNLLIYIGCCQVCVGNVANDTDYGFYRALKKHRENIDKNHSDAAYKDAIAGLINIAYICVKVGKYQDALDYTRHFGELLSEYEYRPGVSADYIDRQLGRYDIYKAQALTGLGRRAEAAEVMESFRMTNFSKTPEGRAFAENSDDEEPQ